MDNRYRFAEDVRFVAEALGHSMNQMAMVSNIPESTFYYLLKGETNQSSRLLESFYDYAYRRGIRLNKAKEELFRESLCKGEILLFHGSSSGIEKIEPSGSRSDCDFSNGFYCGEGYQAALSFVEGDPFSSVYAFKAELGGLVVDEYQADLDWMLSVCYYRGMLKGFETKGALLEILSKHGQADVIIAPIADNRMFRVMRQFGEGEITDVQAIHALSASRLGKQYVFKTAKAIERLRELERLYLCEKEKASSREASTERAYEIQTKLDLAKREFRRAGRYIDEVLV